MSQETEKDNKMNISRKQYEQLEININKCIFWGVVLLMPNEEKSTNCLLQFQPCIPLYIFTLYKYLLIEKFVHITESQ